MLVEHWLIKLPLQTAHSPMTAPICDIIYITASSMYFSKYVQLKPESLCEMTLNVTDFRFSWYFITKVDSSLDSLLCVDAGSVGDILGVHAAATFWISSALKTIPLCTFEMFTKLPTSTWYNKPRAEPVSALYISFSIRNEIFKGEQT
jgi:hypothetical protein